MHSVLEGIKKGAHLIAWADVCTYGILATVGVMGLALTINRPFIRMIAEEVGKRDVQHATDTH